jgi:hypothetical protein
VDDMSAQPITHVGIEENAEQSDWIVRNPNPYADVPTGVLVDTLEGQWERGEPFSPEFVFEALNRALAADELRARLEG